MTALPLRIAIRLSGVFLLTAIVLVAVSLSRAPVWLLGLYLGAGGFSALLYGYDKRAAAQVAWRISEATLQTIDRVGGIIGGLAAQALFRHKTSKTGFGATTAVVYALHVVALGALIAGLYDLG